MYSAEGHELRRDWYGKDDKLGRQHRFVERLRPADEDSGIIAEVGNTDFLAAVSLFHTRERRRAAEVSCASVGWAGKRSLRELSAGQATSYG